MNIRATQMIAMLAEGQWVVSGGRMAAEKASPDYLWKMVVESARETGDDLSINTRMGASTWGFPLSSHCKIELKNPFTIKICGADGAAELMLTNPQKLNEAKQKRAGQDRERDLQGLPKRMALQRERESKARAEQHQREEAERPQKLAELLEHYNAEYGKGVIEFCASETGDLYIKLPDGTIFSPYGVVWEWLYAKGDRIEVY